MAEIRPFKGLRYSPKIVKNMGVVAAPPYDVISPDAQRMYYARSEHNVIRLELGLDHEGDSENNNRHTRARDTFDRWIRDGVLVAERNPSMYLYQHQFEHGGVVRVRRGVIACLRLEELDSGVVLPHEDTLEKPLGDRMSLMRECDANFSPVFGLFEDSTDRVTGLLASVAASHPLVEVKWDDGDTHQLWVIDDPSRLKMLAESIAPCQVLIADGHHRYTTALRYRNERRAASLGFTGDEAYNFVMALLVEINDPGLVILPTHRIVVRKTSDTPDSIERTLSESFEVRHLPINGDPTAKVGAMLRELETAKSSNAFGAFGLREGHFSILLSRNNGGIHHAMPQVNSAAWRSLDVSVLKVAVLEAALGVSEDSLRQGKAVEFVSDEVAAVRAVVEGRASIAWFLRSPTIKQVRDVALASDRMPHKSTYFHPKPLTGLVLNRLAGDLPRPV